MSTNVELQPLDNPALPVEVDHSIMVRIRKEGDTYVAHPKRVRVPQGRCANIVFVLESAPRGAELYKMIIRESSTDGTGSPNPFSIPGKYRVMLLTDDNSTPENQERHFDYVLQVKEGTQTFDVDPGIDNDPPYK